MRLSFLLSSTLVLLSACGELITDTGQACLIPEQLDCTCPWNEDEEPCPSDPFWVPAVGGECTGGYSAGTAYDVQVILRSEGGGPAEDVECSVEVHADHRLSVSASYRQLRDVDDVIEAAVIATCEVPPLEAGTWTLEYAGITTSFVVGDPEIQPLACADTGRLP